MAYYKRYRKTRREVEDIINTDFDRYDMQSSASDQTDGSCSDHETCSGNSNHHLDGSFESSDSTDDIDVITDVEFISSSESESEEENGIIETPLTLRDKLAELVSRHSVSRSFTNDLLLILRNEGLDLPRDSRTLLNTPRSIEVLAKCSGKYAYFGITNTIRQSWPKIDDNTIWLKVNIDGVPIFRSTNA